MKIHIFTGVWEKGIVWYLRDKRVVGAMLLNLSESTDQVKDLIRSQLFFLINFSESKYHFKFEQISVYLAICTYTYINVYTYIQNVWIYVYTYMYTYMHVYMYTCIHIYIYIYIYVCMCIYTQTYRLLFLMQLTTLQYQ